REEAERLPLVRHAVSVAFVGLLVSLSVAVAPLFLGDAILTHRPGPEAEVVHIGTLELLTAVVFDIGVFLLVFGFAVGVVTFFANAIAGASEHAGPGEDAGDGTEAQAGKKR
ncbi:MAG TPA: MnhB domain-containing protein, partial [Rubrobacteraceae bacterium]|nr:MnhB domain-containing protein [Rubrobacteraceae bacterium]